MNYVERARALRPYIEKAVKSLTDADALESVELFPPWKEETAYQTDERVQHGGKLYRVVQAHTSQRDWTPESTTALFTEVFVEEYPEFVAPSGAQDAYNVGDKITFEGKHYVCRIDGTVFSPAEYPQAWEEVE